MNIQQGITNIEVKPSNFFFTFLISKYHKQHPVLKFQSRMLPGIKKVIFGGNKRKRGK